MTTQAKQAMRERGITLAWTFSKGALLIGAWVLVSSWKAGAEYTEIKEQQATAK